jgi:hypothetical protein
MIDREARFAEAAQHELGDRRVVFDQQCSHALSLSEPL